MSYQYSINGTDYYSLQQLQTQETFGASQKVDLYVRAVGSGDTILAAGNREITTPTPATFRRSPVLTSFQTARR